MLPNAQIYQLIGRDTFIFKDDLLKFEEDLEASIRDKRFLVLGAAGSIGQSVVKELFKRQPKTIHAVDISENNLVELVRDLRSSQGFGVEDFQTFALDIGSKEYDAFIKSDGQYDYVLNLSALKHVRSEKDPFTLMRMLNVNVFNTLKTINQSKANGVRKYFCVSTDKAANPVNLMGASKRIMEMFLLHESNDIAISTARFANVAFSDGSLLHGFEQRLSKRQPIAAPHDVKRYFVTPEESGLLCLFSCMFGGNNEIYFPKLDPKEHLLTFSEIAKNFLMMKGLKPIECEKEQDARDFIQFGPQDNQWPCYFSSSDTTGEKPFEEFYTDSEVLDLSRYTGMGVVTNSLKYSENALMEFSKTIQSMREAGFWTKQDLVDAIKHLLPELNHEEKGKYLDSKM